MGILLALRFPVVPGGGLRGRVLLLRVSCLNPSVAQGETSSSAPTSTEHQRKRPSRTMSVNSLRIMCLIIGIP